jgi:hypothetical protein
VSARDRTVKLCMYNENPWVVPTNPMKLPVGLERWQ